MEPYAEELRRRRGLPPFSAAPSDPASTWRPETAPQPTDRLLPTFQRELFTSLLTELDLRDDREGRRRTAYSLRHTYICLRLMEGADIYQIAKNCRTSVDMIQTLYAAHIASTLGMAAINVRKPKPAKRTARKEAADAA